MLLILVERFFNQIKQCRRIASRYDRLAANCLAWPAMQEWIAHAHKEPEEVPEFEAEF